MSQFPAPNTPEAGEGDEEYMETLLRVAALRRSNEKPENTESASASPELMLHGRVAESIEQAAVQPADVLKQMRDSEAQNTAVAKQSRRRNSSGVRRSSIDSIPSGAVQADKRTGASPAVPRDRDGSVEEGIMFTSIVHAAAQKAYDKDNTSRRASVGGPVDTTTSASPAPASVVQTATGGQPPVYRQHVPPAVAASEPIARKTAAAFSAPSTVPSLGGMSASRPEPPVGTYKVPISFSQPSPSPQPPAPVDRSNSPAKVLEQSKQALDPRARTIIVSFTPVDEAPLSASSSRPSPALDGTMKPIEPDLRGSSVQQAPSYLQKQKLMPRKKVDNKAVRPLSLLESPPMAQKSTENAAGSPKEVPAPRYMERTLSRSAKEVKAALVDHAAHTRPAFSTQIHSPPPAEHPTHAHPRTGPVSLAYTVPGPKDATRTPDSTRPTSSMVSPAKLVAYAPHPTGTAPPPPPNNQQYTQYNSVQATPHPNNMRLHAVPQPEQPEYGSNPGGVKRNDSFARRAISAAPSARDVIVNYDARVRDPDESIYARLYRVPTEALLQTRSAEKERHGLALRENLNRDVPQKMVANSVGRSPHSVATMGSTAERGSERNSRITMAGQRRQEARSRSHSREPGESIYQRLYRVPTDAYISLQEGVAEEPVVTLDLRTNLNSGASAFPSKSNGRPAQAPAQQPAKKPDRVLAERVRAESATRIPGENIFSRLHRVPTEAYLSLQEGPEETGAPTLPLREHLNTQGSTFRSMNRGRSGIFRSQSVALHDRPKGGYGSGISRQGSRLDNRYMDADIYPRHEQQQYTERAYVPEHRMAAPAPPAQHAASSAQGYPRHISGSTGGPTTATDSSNSLLSRQASIERVWEAKDTIRDDTDNSLFTRLYNTTTKAYMQLRSSPEIPTPTHSEPSNHAGSRPRLSDHHTVRAADKAPAYQYQVAPSQGGHYVVDTNAAAEYGRQQQQQQQERAAAPAAKTRVTVAEPERQNNGYGAPHAGENGGDTHSRRHLKSAASEFGIVGAIHVEEYELELSPRAVKRNNALPSIFELSTSSLLADTDRGGQTSGRHPPTNGQTAAPPVIDARAGRQSYPQSKTVAPPRVAPTGTTRSVAPQRAAVRETHATGVQHKQAVLNVSAPAAVDAAMKARISGRPVTLKQVAASTKTTVSNTTVPYYRR
jgi:hypothetical protein